MELILLLIFVGCFLFYLLDRRFTFWKRRNVPSIEPEYFYGNTRGIGTKVYSGIFYRDLYFRLKKIGPLVGFYIAWDPVLMATDLDLIKTLLVKDFHMATDRGAYFNEKDDPPSANLSSLEGEKWKTMRNKLTPTFASGKIKMMMPIMAEVADRLINVIDDQNESIEMKLLFSKFTTDVVGKAGFGIECNSLQDETTLFYKMGLRSFGDLNYWKRQFTFNYPDLCRKLGVTVSNFEVVNFYKDIMQQTVKYREENNVKSHDFLALLMELKSKSLLTFNEVWAQTLLFFLGGFETTTLTLTYAIYELSQNREIREKARNTIREALKKYDGEFCYEAVNKMHYLEQCINETLRRHTPSPTTRRILTSQYQVPNSKIVLEKGTKIYIPILGIHHDPDIHPEPLTFNPDRFSPEEVAKRHPYSFLTFGDGPRMCIGARFAIVEVKVALAKILLNYDFELDRSKTPVPLTFGVKRMLLTPQEGVYVKFTKV